MVQFKSMMFILIVLVCPHRETQRGPLPASCSDASQKEAVSQRLQESLGARPKLATGKCHVLPGNPGRPGFKYHVCLLGLSHMALGHLILLLQATEPPP